MMAVGTEDPREGPISFSHCPRGSLGAGVTSLTPSPPFSSLSAAEGPLATRPGGERRATNSPAGSGQPPSASRPPLARSGPGSRSDPQHPASGGEPGCQGNLANTLGWSHSLKPLMVEQSAGWSLGGQRTRAQTGTRGTPGSLPPEPGHQDGVKSFSLPHAVSSQPGRGCGQHTQGTVSCWQGPEPTATPGVPTPSSKRRRSPRAG